MADKITSAPRNKQPVNQADKVETTLGMLTLGHTDSIETM